ncbi:Crp/Fnr family transcriptional regulator [Actinacidiphila guanduensis]|uniref:cAMP-binding domain of CRP or a regulatory subunit of cAMP-dependent protein kinases n=1 Tax=Actinacidiphila guanduensis TaxID=310781 RepID=A0A1H0IS58_9ACTN|nr:cAMP-binding domain of CRP or a regulatory subunit of cAMP-dependent protein kinases [Actinacidiphila guanduensis]
MGLLGDRKVLMERLSSADRQSLLSLGRPRTYAAQEVLLREGDSGGFIVVITRGWCTVRRSTERGTLILALRQAGELVGEMAALDGRARSATVAALGPVQAVLVPGDRFRSFLAARPYATGLVMSQLIARLRSADDERSALASATVLERLAGRLVELAERAGTDQGGAVAIRLPLSQSDLAAAVGATREAVAKALRLLRDEGLVTTAPRAIAIADLEPLRLLGGAAGEAGEPGAAGGGRA